MIFKIWFPHVQLHASTCAWIYMYTMCLSIIVSSYHTTGDMLSYSGPPLPLGLMYISGLVSVWHCNGIQVIYRLVCLGNFTKRWYKLAALS